ncbi:hypothetical protein [Algoriphagus litoralis]|uniref:hypothetical protein n=1 Tax=Algoriphagus litoralis TaxID=2202829 RepID=UPI0013004D23|nr:hypothetical protein [Algoriphagus litoralis]
MFISLTMKFRHLMEDLLDLETRSIEKTENLIRESGGTLALSRLRKGHQIIAMARTIRLLIEQNKEDEAEILLTLLEEIGVTLPAR